MKADATILAPDVRGALGSPKHSPCYGGSREESRREQTFHAWCTMKGKVCS